MVLNSILNRVIATFIAITCSLFVPATGQSPPAKDAFVYAASRYKVADRKSITIQNSLPKGGGVYKHASGKKISYVIFWTRLVNEAAAPLELTIKFPADSFAIFPSPDSYLKIFMPPGTMTIDKVSMEDYGVTGLTSFLDTGFYKPAMLQRTINANGEFYFYVGMLFYEASGSARSELVVKDGALFYKISVGPQHALIPCGQIVFDH